MKTNATVNELDQALNAERISRAEEDRTAGVLNLIKAVKELEGMDIEALIKKVQLLQSIELHQAAKEETIKSEGQGPGKSTPSQLAPPVPKLTAPLAPFSPSSPPQI